MNKKESIYFRVTPEEKEKIEQKKKSLGFESLSDYLRFVALNATIEVKIENDNTEA